MKKLIFTSMIAILLAGMSAVSAQDMPEEYLGLPGDNLNLYAVMQLFQESETLEGFERNLNDENSRINNLDLNGDNLVDYIMVTDYAEGDLHNIVLRVALNEKENQDVAVFTVEKFNDGSVQIQLIGDEALYGKNYIIEPIYAETPNPGYTGNAGNATRVEVVTTTYQDIARWPVVVYVYNPGYVTWHSSWYWGYWPNYWYGWTPYYWDYYYGYHYNWYSHYYTHYHHWDHYRCHWYNDHYYNRVRVYSPMVAENIHHDHYRTTYSRPDLRKNGEELYVREQSGRVDRRYDVNRSSADEGRVKTSTGTNERRTIGSEYKGSLKFNSSGRTSGTSGRSTSTGTVKSDRSSSDNRSVETTRRSTYSGTNRSSGSSSSGRSSGSVHKSSSSGSGKSSGSTSGRSSGSSTRSSSGKNSSSDHNSGSVNKSSSSGSGKSEGSTSGRSSGSSSRSSSGKSSSSSSGSGKTTSDHPRR